MKAQFKTAYLQRELVVDAKISTELAVGDVVTIAGTGDSATISKVANSTAPANTHFIVAQSDMTMDRRDYTKHQYEYSDKVAASTELKKVALFKVIDPSDVVYTN